MFKTLIEQFKNSPTMSIIVFIIATAGYVSYVDDRYAHAADLNKQTGVLANKIEINTLQNDVGTLKVRESYLKDKVFDLTVKNGKTPGEQASLNRYTKELDDTSKEIRGKQILADKLKAGAQ